MKLLVFSDSHSHYEKIAEAISIQKTPCDAVVFLGDGLRDIEKIKEKIYPTPVFSVKGNCDFLAGDTEEERLLSLEGVKIFITHGHLYGAKSGYGRLLYRARELEADLVLFGHTHCPLDYVYEISDKKIRLFNPGSIGHSGTFGVINICGNVVVSSCGKI